MGIEIPKLPLEAGKSITMEQLFKAVGTTVVEAGLAPEKFASDEWAIASAENYKVTHFPEAEVVEDKKEK